MNKKFVACIYLYRGHAVKNITDLTIVDMNPVNLASYYSEKNADEIIVFDMSDIAAAENPSMENPDILHDAALDMMKAICAKAEVDVIGAGNIKRMEDVKKILYTGCKKAILDYNNDENIAITKEVSLKFGKDKILAAVSHASVCMEQKELLEQYVGGLLLMNPQLLREVSQFTSLPYYVHINDLPLNHLLTIFSMEQLWGITGNVINYNVREILTLKDFCLENGIAVETMRANFKFSDFKKNSDGLVPVIVQDYKTQEVLMLAYMNEEAYNATIKCGKMTYYSRSRKELWLKGETSGHYQYVKSLAGDCDMDTILAKVSQIGVACHTGAKSCFFNTIAQKEQESSSNPLKVFEDVFDVIKDRKIHPKEGSYTNYLFDKGIDKILKKLGEEATEIVIAAKNPNANEIKYEISDFLYHMMVLMAEKEVTWEEITTELANR